MEFFRYTASKKSSSRIAEQSQEDPDGFKAFELILFPHIPVQVHSCTALVFIKETSWLFLVS